MGVVIIGGGVVGLTTAIALRQAGHEATVYERVDDVAASQIGAGLGLAYNATRVLRKIGLLDSVEASGQRIDRFEFRSAKGKLLSYWTVPEGEAHVGITRKRLHEILVAALPDDGLVLGRTCSRFEQEASSATAVFEDGSTIRGSLLIGADGLRSTIRAQLLGADEPRYAGFSVSRTVVPADDENPLPADVFRLFWGTGASFGMYAVGPALIYVFGWWNAPEGDHVPRGQRKETLLQRFRGWAPEIQALLERSTEESIHQTDIHDRPAAESWVTGRVGLAGDAAHAMTFNTGQGACQGIEDAAVLARCVAADGEEPSALVRFQSERLPRATEFTRLSARAASMSVAGNPVATLRNLALRGAARQVSRGERKLMIDV